MVKQKLMWFWRLQSNYNVNIDYFFFLTIKFLSLSTTHQLCEDLFQVHL